MTACLSAKCTAPINFSVPPQTRHSRFELPSVSAIFSALNISIGHPPGVSTDDRQRSLRKGQGCASDPEFSGKSGNRQIGSQVLAELGHSQMRNRPLLLTATIKNRPQISDNQKCGGACKIRDRGSSGIGLTTSFTRDSPQPFLEELKRKIPRDEKGKPKHKLFQMLTTEVAHPKLVDHFKEVLAIMRGARTWAEFYEMLDRSLPRFNETLQLPFYDTQAMERLQPPESKEAAN